MELQDFTTEFCCIGIEDRKDKFQKELTKTAFEPLRNRCEFFTYEQVENDYKIAISKTFL